MDLFGKRFSQVRSASKLFNEATKYWAKAGKSLQAKDERKLIRDLIEVIRFCQLSIEADEQYGDSYVLLADALLLAGTFDSRSADRRRSWFLVTRAAAVIHAWYSLPHRGYPITKNVARGEQLFKTILEIVNAGEIQSKDATMKLIDTYRDTLAAQIISPAGLNEISDVLLNVSIPTEPDSTEFQSQSQSTNQWLEETLPPPLANFIFKVVSNLAHETPVLQVGNRDAVSRIREATENLQETILIPRALEEIMARFKEAYVEKDWRQMLGWVADLRLIIDYRKNKPGYDIASVEKLEAQWAKLLSPTTNEARQAKDYDTLLLAIGYYHYLDIDEIAAKLLKEVQNELSEHELYSRMHSIQDNPRMIFEAGLINKTRDFLKSQ